MGSLPPGGIVFALRINLCTIVKLSSLGRRDLCGGLSLSICIRGGVRYSLLVWLQGLRDELTDPEERPGLRHDGVERLSDGEFVLVYRARALRWGKYLSFEFLSDREDGLGDALGDALPGEIEPGDVGDGPAYSAGDAVRPSLRGRLERTWSELGDSVAPVPGGVGEAEVGGS
jgi:hypothetical protein